jgi:2-C-methyl-D-erythritol 4-phosphate cytidylyltransferase/2-C-methyl-D-erythritol 2,4-cyclodiphosphate synthase
MEEQLYGIIAAAGMGKRAQLGYNKNYAPLGHVPILVRNLHALSGIAFLTHVIIAVAPKELTEARALLQKYEAAFFPTLSWSLVPGGRERQTGFCSGRIKSPF